MDYKVPGNYFDRATQPSQLFDLNRNQRKPYIREIILDVLRQLVSEPVTKSRLRDLTMLRKQTLIRWLPELVRIGAAIRSGGGTRGNPFKYRIADSWRHPVG